MDEAVGVVLGVTNFTIGKKSVPLIVLFHWILFLRRAESLKVLECAFGDIIFNLVRIMLRLHRNKLHPLVLPTVCLIELFLGLILAGDVRIVVLM